MKITHSFCPLPTLSQVSFFGFLIKKAEMLRLHFIPVGSYLQYLELVCLWQGFFRLMLLFQQVRYHQSVWFHQFTSVLARFWPLYSLRRKSADCNFLAFSVCSEAHFLFPAGIKSVGRQCTFSQ